MEIEQALDQFILQLRANGRSEHTVAQYARTVRSLARWTAHEGLSQDLSGYSQDTVARFLSSGHALLRPDGERKKQSSVNAMRSSIKCFSAYLHKSGLTSLDAGHLVRRAVCTEAPPVTLSEADHVRLLQTLASGTGRAAGRDYALIHLMLRTGIRVSAVLAIEVQDVDLDRSELVLRKGKSGAQQRIFLSEDVQQHLATYMASLDSDVLFPKGNGAFITVRHLQRRLHYWLDEAGVRRVSPHTLRHTFAMGLYRKTRDLLLVQRALGHRSLTSTLRYAHASDDDLRAAMSVAAA